MNKLDEKQKNQFIFALQIAMYRAYAKGRESGLKSKEEGKSEYYESLKEFEEWRDNYIKDIADASGLV